MDDCCGKCKEIVNFIEKYPILKQIITEWVLENTKCPVFELDLQRADYTCRLKDKIVL